MTLFADCGDGFSQTLERHDHACTDDGERGNQEKEADEKRRNQKVRARLAEHALDRPLHEQVKLGNLSTPNIVERRDRIDLVRSHAERIPSLRLIDGSTICEETALDTKRLPDHAGKRRRDDFR